MTNVIFHLIPLYKGEILEFHHKLVISCISVSGGTEKMRVLISLLLLAFACKEVVTSHFRGGTVSWRHLSSNGTKHQLEIAFRLGWRNDYFTPVCDDEQIGNRTAGRAEGQWEIKGSATSTDFPHSVATICTTFDPLENWAYGKNTFTATVDSSGTFNIQFQGGAWINSLYFGSGSSWSVAATNIDLDLRSDTGRVNNPPVTFSPPVVRLILGCPSTIKITSSDADGDKITCRYAVGKEECDGVCGTFAHFTLNQESCTIDYDGGGGNFLVPVALMLEDHPNTNITIGSSHTVSTSDPISATPLQFLVNIATSANSICNAIPTIPPGILEEGTNITMPSNGTFKEILKARPGESGGTIKRFIVLGPVGMATDGVKDEGNDTFSTNLTWTPTDDQGGDHDVCFYAIDGNGNSGDQRCFTVTVAVKPFDPCELDNGGCSDICIKTNASHVCSCSHACWELSSDRKTCVPKMMVECTGEDVTIAVADCSTDRTVVAGSEIDYFSQRNCQSTKRGSDHLLNFGSQECGLKMEVSPVSVDYSISVWTWKEADAGSESSVITRGQWGRVPVICSLPSSLMLNGSFVPVLPLNAEFFPEDVSIDGMGSFTLYFEYYRNREFSIVFRPSEYPVQVTVSDEIFFSLGAVGRTGLQLFTEECTAATSRVVTPSTLTYQFISDGCLVDDTVTRYNSSSPMENRFSVQSFEFEDKLLSDRSDSEIFLLCRVILCDSTRNDTRCSRGCIEGNRRRRRAVDGDSEVIDDDNDDSAVPLEFAESSPQTLSSRFIFVFDTAEQNNTAVEETSISFTNWILLGVGILILSIAIFIAFYIVKSRHRAQEAKSQPVRLSKIATTA